MLAKLFEYVVTHKDHILMFTDQKNGYADWNQTLHGSFIVDVHFLVGDTCLKSFICDGRILR